MLCLFPKLISCSAAACSVTRLLCRGAARPLFVLSALVIAGAPAVCFSDDTIIPVTMSAPASHTTYYTTGLVVAVSVADPARGQRSELTVRSDSGRLDTLLVKATTTIYDNAGTAVPLDAIRKEQRVKVKYLTSTEGVHEALSIRLLK